MQKTNILLWVNNAHSWTVEVDGMRYEDLTPDAVQQYLRFTLMYAATSVVTYENSVWTLTCFVSGTEQQDFWQRNDIDALESPTPVLQ